jgi:hypothetical protein
VFTLSLLEDWIQEYETLQGVRVTTVVLPNFDFRTASEVVRSLRAGKRLPFQNNILQAAYSKKNKPLGYVAATGPRFSHYHEMPIFGDGPDISYTTLHTDQADPTSRLGGPYQILPW